MHTLNYSPCSLIGIAAAVALTLCAPHIASAQVTSNTAYGTNALQSNSGLNNSAFGYNALNANTSGDPVILLLERMHFP